MATPRLRLPGFVSAHSHGFQRALRGRVTGRDFWAWRQAMLDEAARHTPDTVRAAYADVYRELLGAGYTAVGEFHYLGFAEALAALDAAREAGIDIVLLLAAYERGGLERFRQPSLAAYLDQVSELRALGARVGLAPHSVRACSRGWLEAIGEAARRLGLVLHVHADEQPREIASCLAEHGLRPIELLADTGCLGPRTTVVHATHADANELDLLAESGARVCLCPTTEANLGDGFAPVRELLARGIPICIGSDSNVRVDPLEELRELDGIARRAALARDVVPLEPLLAIGSTAGAAAIGLDAWRDVEVDPAHRCLRGIDPENIPAALVQGCSGGALSPA
ncbi:MAG TPA: amidohydrolase family protein [Gaiellaceae bacterium]|nr:amidohydrolase family protein [Gaiellaceae bacterium]